MNIVIFYIALFIGIIPLLVLLFKNKAFDTRQPVILFVWLTAIAVVYEYVGTILLKKGTAHWFQLYDLLEFTALFYFFYKVLPGRYKIVLYTFLALFGATYILSLLTWDKYNALKTININAVPTVILVFTGCGLWFKNLFDKADVPNPWQSVSFYFIAGFIIYYSSTFFLFLLSNFIFESESLYIHDYWVINVMATLILRILMIIGIWKMKPD